QSGSLGTATASLQHMRIANVDSDPALEIVVAEHGGALWFIDGATHAIELQTANLSTRAIDTADLNGDGISEVFVANSFNVRLLDSSTGTIASTLFTASSTSLQAIRVGNVISGPPLEIACATFSKVSIHKLD